MMSLYVSRAGTACLEAALPFTTLGHPGGFMHMEEQKEKNSSGPPAADRHRSDSGV